jgi:hypothetical protein
MGTFRLSFGLSFYMYAKKKHKNHNSNIKPKAQDETTCSIMTNPKHGEKHFFVCLPKLVLEKNHHIRGTSSSYGNVILSVSPRHPHNFSAQMNNAL